MKGSDLLLTPKDLAAAIGASESSLRRWIDSGDIRVSRTAGGHRRVPLAEAVRFIRKMGAVVVRPELLQLPTTVSTGEPADRALRLFDALVAGDRDMSRGLLLSWYIEGDAAHALFDGPVREAMQRIGELWKHDQRGILLEHRATEICRDAIAALRSLLPPPPEGAPLAIGGALEGDPYQVPSTMAATVLADAGMRESNFGASTPPALLVEEAAQSQAILVWLSISAVANDKTAIAQVKDLARSLALRHIEFVVGGRGLANLTLPRDLRNLHVVNSMAELSAFARGLISEQSRLTPPTTPSIPIH